MTTLCQVDDDETCKSQPHICMNGVPDVQKLQGPQCRCEEGQETKVHEPARPGTSRCPRSGPLLGLSADGRPLRSSWVLDIHGSTHLSI